jgi:predicted DNA-binding transcriptional regulator AlpA
MSKKKSKKEFIRTNQLRKRWGGCSHMFIERRLKSDPTFPRPVKFGGRLRLWDLDEVEAYERKCAAGEAEAERAVEVGAS